ncbi:hypothetical protein DFH08DRAFT_618205, partial [Mycena albidolilacea]
VDTLEIRGICPACNIPEISEHIALECDTPSQKLIWTDRAAMVQKYRDWPKLNWGLVPGCNLVKFKSLQGKVTKHKGRLFTILVLVGRHLIWNLRVDRAITNPDRIITNSEIHNQWLKAVNSALQCDRMSTDKLRLGPLALKSQLVLNTWS